MGFSLDNFHVYQKFTLLAAFGLRLYQSSVSSNKLFSFIESMLLQKIVKSIFNIRNLYIRNRDLSESIKFKNMRNSNDSELPFVVRKYL